MILHRILFKLYNIQESLSGHAEEIKNANEQLVGLRAEQQECEAALEETRTEQARQRTDVMQKEKRLKKAEKALEGKVILLIMLPSSGSKLTISSYPKATRSRATRSANCSLGKKTR